MYEIHSSTKERTETGLWEISGDLLRETLVWVNKLFFEWLGGLSFYSDFRKTKKPILVVLKFGVWYLPNEKLVQGYVGFCD